MQLSNCIQPNDLRNLFQLEAKEGRANGKASFCSMRRWEFVGIQVARLQLLKACWRGHQNHTGSQAMARRELADLRTRLIDHILWLKNKDPDYARQALKSYHEAMPWLDLMQGVRERMAA